MMTVYEERGISKGISQGEVKRAQEDVLEVLEVRFGNVPILTKEKVVYCDDLAKLKKAHRTALLIKSFDEFTV